MSDFTEKRISKIEDKVDKLQEKFYQNKSDLDEFKELIRSEINSGFSDLKDFHIEKISVNDKRIDKIENELAEKKGSDNVKDKISRSIYLFLAAIGGGIITNFNEIKKFFSWISLIFKSN